MPLSEERLQQDLREAMKARDALRTSVLRGVIAAVKNVKVEKMGAPLAEADLTAIVRKEVNKRSEAIAFAEKAGRRDLVDQNKAELAVLEAYMPAQMDAATLEAAIRRIAADLGTTQIGPVMAELRKRHAGQFDGKAASELIKKL